MRKQRRHKFNPARGQGTVELVLLLPILMFLFSLIAYTFREHHESKNETVSRHYETLKSFNHGNGGPVIIDGEVVIPERGIMKMREGPGSIWPPLGGPLQDLAGAIGAQIALDNLFNSIGFFNSSSYLSEYSRAYVNSAVNGLVTTGNVDWRAAQTAGYTAALSSNEATRDFQGMGFESANAREFFGSTLQSATISFAGSDGDWSAAAGGAITGSLGSDTSQLWFENGNQEIFKGAFKGAIQGGLTGLARGESVGLGDLAKFSGMGAFQTRPVARMLPMGNWEANGNDPRGSAAFGAANAGFSILMSQGGKANFGDYTYAALGGAFFSGQNMSHVQGTGGQFSRTARSTVATGAYQSGAMAAQGADSEEIRSAFYGNLAGAGAAYAGGMIQGQVNRGVTYATTGVQNAVDVNALLGRDEAVEAAATSMTESLPAEDMGNLFGVYAPYQEVPLL